MKRLSRTQLRRFISEVTVQATPDSISSTEDAIQGAGGAIDAKTLEDELETDDVDGQAALDAVIAAAPNIAKHEDGDIIDMSGIKQQTAESKMRKLIRKAILEVLR